MSGWLSGPRDSRPLGHSAIDGGGDPFSGARVVSVAHFEPAAGMQGEALDSYKRRFGTLFVDESTRRRGGIGSVVCATNVLGEQFALKTLVIPERDERASEAEYERYEAGLKTAFRQEFECHKAVSGLKGFPHLYGMGEVAGMPAIVMEWVCGETLVRVCDALAVDGAGRMPTLVAAQIGRDVFDLLAHLDFLEGGFVHRDISLANVMVRTSRLSLAEQVEEGFFDVCLIDFGSSTPEEMQGSSFTRVSSLTRKATADFAPPEMLTEDIAGIDALRKSPKIDVYATASVVYRLACGRAPFDLEAEAAQSAAGSGDATDSRGEKGSGKNAEATKRAFSPYRVKTEAAPPAPCSHMPRRPISPPWFSASRRWTRLFVAHARMRRKPRVSTKCAMCSRLSMTSSLPCFWLVFPPIRESAPRRMRLSMRFRHFAVTIWKTLCSRFRANR